MKNYLLFLLLFILSYIIPKKKKLLLFGAGDSKQFQGNPKYLLLYLKQKESGNFEYYWSAKLKEQQAELEKRNIPFIDPYTLKGFWKILRAEYLFIEKASYDVYYTKNIFGRFNFIQTWHGSPLKKIGTDAKEHIKNDPSGIPAESIIYKFLKKIKFFSRQKFKLILATSEKVKEIYQRTFENTSVVITGYPRNDVFFNPGLLLNDYEKEFDLKKYNKVILYAPTFRDHSAVLSPFPGDLAGYNEQLKEKNYLFLIKKHPWQKNLQVDSNFSNIIDLSEKVDDIHELLPFTDVLVTDYSGIFFDFILTGKPVVYYAYDLEEYIRKCRGLYFDYQEFLPGPFAFNEPDLFRYLFTIGAWSNEEEYIHKYNNLLNYYNDYKEGGFSQRTLELLYPDIKLN